MPPRALPELHKAIHRRNLFADYRGKNGTNERIENQASLHVPFLYAFFRRIPTASGSVSQVGRMCRAEVLVAPSSCLIQ